MSTRTLWGQDESRGYHPKSVPAMQAIPLPDDKVSIQQNGMELIRFHYRGDLRRPFVYPVNGPSGRSLTRMGHPHDPITHSHHNSVWISHHQVNGIDFWGDHGSDKGRILTRHIEKLMDSDDQAGVVSLNEWKDSQGTVLLNEWRHIAVKPNTHDQYLIVMDLKLKASVEEVTFSKTPFGVVGVRMAKTIGVHDGGGRILNSEGHINEKEIFWKSARWVDYSGQIANGTIEGITLLDHSNNPNHPSVFHVRNDGWMGACLTFHEDLVLKHGETLQLRYGLYVHSNLLTVSALDAVWEDFNRAQPYHFEDK